MTPYSILHGLVFSIALAVSPAGNTTGLNLLPSEMPETPIAEWQTMPGDAFVVDTDANIGYLVHKNGGYTSFVVGSGQRKVVRYGGMTYDATTPTIRWTVKKKDIQNDKITFGKDGIFLRLFDDKGSTKYGIHSTQNIRQILGSTDRYKSMGCVLVSDEMLAIIEDTFVKNGNTLDVLTTYGFDDDSVNYASLLAKTEVK